MVPFISTGKLSFGNSTGSLYCCLDFFFTPKIVFHFIMSTLSSRTVRLRLQMSLVGAYTFLSHSLTLSHESYVDCGLLWLRALWLDKLKIGFVGRCNSIAIKVVINENGSLLLFVRNFSVDFSSVFFFFFLNVLSRWSYHHRSRNHLTRDIGGGVGGAVCSSVVSDSMRTGMVETVEWMWNVNSICGSLNRIASKLIFSSFDSFLHQAIFVCFFLFILYTFFLVFFLLLFDSYDSFSSDFFFLQMVFFSTFFPLRSIHSNGVK